MKEKGPDKKVTIERESREIVLRFVVVPLSLCHSSQSTRRLVIRFLFHSNEIKIRTELFGLRSAELLEICYKEVQPKCALLLLVPDQ